MEEDTKSVSFIISYVVVSMLIGGITLDYCLASLVGRDIPWYLDAILGFFLVKLTVPVALISLALRAAGVDAPFFDA